MTRDSTRMPMVLRRPAAFPAMPSSRSPAIWAPVLAASRPAGSLPCCEQAMTTAGMEPGALSHGMHDVVDAGHQCLDVGGVDGGEDAQAQLVAAEFAVGVGVKDPVGSQDVADH